MLTGQIRSGPGRSRRHSEGPLPARAVQGRRAVAVRGETLDVCGVARDHVGVLFIDGRYVETLSPGEYAFWKGPADARLVEIDLRETMVDVSGQDIMTADKVTLRLNAVVTYKIVDARKAVSQTDDVRQALLP